MVLEYPVYSVYLCPMSVYPMSLYIRCILSLISVYPVSLYLWSLYSVYLQPVSLYVLFILGLKTALVEKFDFSSGTSSRSTKLIHGGVRYLQKAILGLDVEQVQSG